MDDVLLPSPVVSKDVNNSSLQPAAPAAPKRPMRAFAEGLLWLDRFRAVEAESSLPGNFPPLSADEVYALAYAKGYFAGQESVADRFVGCENLSRDKIWRRIADAIAWANESVEQPMVRSAKVKEPER